MKEAYAFDLFVVDDPVQQALMFRTQLFVWEHPQTTLTNKYGQISTILVLHTRSSDLLCEKLKA